MPTISPGFSFVCDRCRRHFYEPGALLTTHRPGQDTSKPPYADIGYNRDTGLGPATSTPTTHAPAPGSRSGRTKIFCSHCEMSPRVGPQPVTNLTVEIHGKAPIKVQVAQVSGLSRGTAAGAAMPLLIPITPLVNGRPGNSLVHPNYPRGTIRQPGAATGTNLGETAKQATPPDTTVKSSLHVHVGRGGNQRVLFGWGKVKYVLGTEKTTRTVKSMTIYLSD